MRIVYCLDSINGVGGIQRVTLIKANALAALPENEVWIIVADNSGKRFSPLSSTIHFIDLGINYYQDDWKSRFHVLKGILFKRIIHKKRLAEALRKILPDIVIGVGQSEKFFLPQIKGRWSTVREFHFCKDYRRRVATDLFEKTVALFGDCLDWFILRRYDRIVVLTQEDLETNWRGIKNVTVIPNPAWIKSEGVSSLDQKRVLAVGRLSSQKNFASLIRAYSIVAKRFPDWRLDILGEGEERERLTRLISNLALDGKVTLCGNTIDVQKEMLSSSIFALSSKFEGFAMVLLEAIGCGLPCVCYSCPCGPKDVFTDGVNGFLVPVGDEMLLAEKICYLIENEAERRRMGHEALMSSIRFDSSLIIQTWIALFRELSTPVRKK